MNQGTALQEISLNLHVHQLVHFLRNEFKEFGLLNHL